MLNPMKVQWNCILIKKILNLKLVIKLYAAIDTKISSLDDKITKNKNKLEDTRKDTALFFLGNSMFDGKMVFKPI